MKEGNGSRPIIWRIVYATAARRRNPERYRDGGNPSWHLFQLAFLLLNVASIADPKNKFRENVELIFFPTGGGKTEAYLGVIASTLLLRRLRGVSRPDGGLGVAVLLRYTLRLLTLDQLGRAATLMCALEEIRKERTKALGEVRFSVGLWVGQSATSNTIAEVTRQILIVHGLQELRLEERDHALSAHELSLVREGAHEGQSDGAEG